MPESSGAVLQIPQKFGPLCTLQPRDHLGRRSRHERRQRRGEGKGRTVQALMFDHERSTRAESASAGDAACQAADDDIDIRCVDVEQLGQASAGAA